MTRNFSEGNKGLVVIEEKDLTKPESSRLNILEKAIQENFLGFVIVGMALAEISEKRLYRTRKGRTFAEYCNEIWDVNARRAYQLIESAAVMENVKNFSQTETQVIDFITPQNEAQAKELAKLKPEEQGAVWGWVVSKADIEDSKITASSVKKAVCEFRGEKLKKVIKQATETTSVKEKKTVMSPEFEEAWMAFWKQVEKERQENWRHTSKSVVYERTEIILEAIKETGIKAQRESEVAK